MSGLSFHMHSASVADNCTISSIAEHASVKAEVTSHGLGVFHKVLQKTARSIRHLSTYLTTKRSYVILILTDVNKM
jgi:hypothetical protein